MTIIKSESLGEALVKILIFVLLIMTFLSAGGCASIEKISVPPEPEKGRVTLYFNGPDKAELNITFDFKAISLTSEKGIHLDLLSAPLVINSKSVRGGQILISETYLPPGKYISMKVVLGEAKLSSEKGTASLALPPGVEIPVNVSIERNQDTALFLSWDADASVNDGYLFSPSFYVRGQRTEIASLLLFVSNEGSGNVSVIDRQLDKVVGVVKTGEQPRGLTVGVRGGTFRVYSANYGSNSVTVIDPTTNKAENEMLVRLGRGPRDLASVVLGDGRELLFVANTDSNNVSIIDAFAGTELSRVKVGEGPIAIAADPPLAEFENSPFLDQEDLQAIKDYRRSFLNVYTANSLSKNISVLKVDTLTGQLRDLLTLEAEWNPIALSFDPGRARLYVANHDSEKISVINMAALARGDISGAVSRIGDFGMSNTGVLPDPLMDRIYVLKESPGEVTIVSTSDRFSGVDRPDLPVLGILPVGDEPHSLLLDQEGRKIYVVNGGSDSVLVINKTTRQVEKSIPVGKRPFGIISLPTFK